MSCFNLSFLEHSYALWATAMMVHGVWRVRVRLDRVRRVESNGGEMLSMLGLVRVRVSCLGP